MCGGDLGVAGMVWSANKYACLDDDATYHRNTSSNATTSSRRRRGLGHLPSTSPVTGWSLLDTCSSSMSMMRVYNLSAPLMVTLPYTTPLGPLQSKPCLQPEQQHNITCYYPNSNRSTTLRLTCQDCEPPPPRALPLVCAFTRTDTCLLAWPRGRQCHGDVPLPHGPAVVRVLERVAAGLGPGRLLAGRRRTS